MNKLFSPAFDNVHDNTLLKLDFNLEHSEIEIIVEEEVGGLRKSFRFKGVSNINLIDLNSFSSFELIEISTVNVKRCEDAFNVEFVFILGFSMPSWNVSFDFKQLEYTFNS